MKKTIYFIIESDVRELDSKILLSLTAAKNGMTGVITKKSRLFEKLHLIRPGIIFFKSFGKNYDTYLKKIKKFGHLISGFDEEGLQLYDKNKLIGDRFSGNVLNNLNFIFSNGDYSKNIYKKYFKKNKKKVEIISSGHPKIDVLKKTAFKYFFNRKIELNRKFGKFVLIATQFPFYNLNTIDIDKNPNHFPMFNKNLLKSKLSLVNKNKLKLFLHQKKNFFAYKELYDFLSRKLPNINFIIKPHPAENYKFYKNMKIKKKFKNIKVLDSGEPITPYLLACDTVIAYNSTTSIESFLLNKISINYIPHKDKFSEFKLTKLLSLDANNLNLIKNILQNKKYRNKNIVSKKNKIEAKKILNNLHSGNAAEIIIKKISSIKVNPLGINDKKKNSLNFMYFFLKTKLINMFNHFFNRHKVTYKVQVGKRDGLNREYVQKKVSEMSRILYPKNKFIVKEKYYGLYYIEIVK